LHLKITYILYSMKKLIGLFACSVLFLTSCSSNDSNDAATVNESDVLVTKSIESYANGDPSITTNYTYNGKKMIKSIDSEGYYELYTYTGDLLTKIDYYDSDDTLEETETFAYNSNGKLATYVRAEFTVNQGVRETFVYNNDGTVSTTTYFGDTTSQTDVLNTSTIEFSGSEVAMTTLNTGSMHMYTYDTKNNPFKNVIGFDKIAVLEAESVGLYHNILTDTYTESSLTHIYNSVYTYNALNFPLTWAESESTSPASTITTQYFYND